MNNYLKILEITSMGILLVLLWGKDSKDSTDIFSEV